MSNIKKRLKLFCEGFCAVIKLSIAVVVFVFSIGLISSLLYDAGIPDAIALGMAAVIVIAVIVGIGRVIFGDEN